MRTFAQRRALCLNLYHAVLMMATPRALANWHRATSASDESEKLLYVLTVLAAYFDDEESRLYGAEWFDKMDQAHRFAEELSAAFLADPEHAQDVIDLTAESVPKGLAQRIYIVLQNAIRELLFAILRPERGQN